MSSDNSSEKHLNEFINLYHPIDFTNEQIIDNNELEKNYPTQGHYVIVPKMVRHFINKMRVYKLFENYVEKGNNYDIVISLRVDLFFNEKIMFPSNISENTIYIPSGYDYAGINDQFAYGDVITMKKYMNLHKNIDDLVLIKNTPYHPESLTKANLEFYNININRFDLSYYIVR